MIRELKRMLRRPLTDIAIGVGCAETALIVQRECDETGYSPVIWASGFAISTLAGKPDCNFVPVGQILTVWEEIADAVNLPLLVDADTGYGDYKIARNTAVDAQKRGVAGICIEDKKYPKTNSFHESKGSQLVTTGEFQGKIKAIKDASGLVVVARTEAFVTGDGLNEVIRRCEAYVSAGADAVLVHSKSNCCDEVDEFMKEWSGRHPVVIVPTTYGATPFEHFQRSGISLVIWANHPLRAANKAKAKIIKEIILRKSPARMESEIATMSEVFNLVGMNEIKKEEHLYLVKEVDGETGDKPAATDARRFAVFDVPKAAAHD